MHNGELGQLEVLFHAARQLASDVRSRFLEQECGSDRRLREQVEALLIADEGGHDLVDATRIPSWRLVQANSPSEFEHTLASATLRKDVADFSDIRLCQRFGGYQVIAEIGRGGMGIVYEAQQEHPVRRRVALKVIKSGMDTDRVIRRFENERQMLAVMDHPGIARIFDGGTTSEGRPYFVMEYVAGRPITDYCREPGLGLRRRLELFIEVCNAVQHAHQKGVIHRDLKPSNVLVADVDGRATPCIIDFGIAKVIGGQAVDETQLTEQHHPIGTPAYMSPEQAGLTADIDTRSDIYSLGVLLFEVLTGVTPFDAEALRRMGPAEFQRMIREVDPPRMSARVSASDARKLRGDLDCITLKCLEKDRGRRYETASGLARDVEHYLRGEAIEAKRDSAWYVLRKQIVRYKLPALAVTAVLVSLLIGLLGTLWQAHRVNERAQALAKAEVEQRRLTEAESVARRRAERINDFVTKALSSSDPYQRGAQDLTVWEAMQQAIQQLDSGELNGQPETEVSLRLTISSILSSNARAAEALPVSECALEINKKLHPGDHLDTVMSLEHAGLSLRSLGRPTEALSKYEAALEMRQRLKADDPEVAMDLNHVASCLQSLGRPAEALAQCEAALEMRQKYFDGDEHGVAVCLNNLGLCFRDLGRSLEALPKLESGLEMYQRLFKGDHPEVSAGLNNVAACLRSLGRHNEALPKFEAALEISQRLFDSDHPDVAHTLNNVGACLRSLNRPAEALAKNEAALEMNQRLFKGDNPDVAATLLNVGYSLESLGRAVEALPKFEAALEMFRRLFNGDHPSVATSLSAVAGCLRSLGRLAEALLDFEEALEMNRRLFGGDHPDVAAGLDNMAHCLQALGRPEEALPNFEAALEMRQRLAQGDSPDVANSLYNTGSCMLVLGQSTDALPHLEAALGMHRRVLPVDHPNTLYPQLACARALRNLDRYAEAEQLLVDAFEQCARSHASYRIHWRTVLNLSVQFYEGWNAAEPDKGHGEKAAEWQARLAEWRSTTQRAADEAKP